MSKLLPAKGADGATQTLSIADDIADNKTHVAVTVTNTVTQIFAANTNRNSYWIQNPSTLYSIWIDEHGDDPVKGPPSLQLKPGAFREMSHPVTQTAIKGISDGSSVQISAKES